MPTSDRDRYFFPPKGAPESEILAYRDRRINRWSIYRNQHMGRIALSIWYCILRQWAELDFEAAFDGIRGAIIRDAEISDLPRPITDEIWPAVEAEMVAQIGKGWKSKITPTSSDPAIKAAARIAEDRLNYQLKRLDWDAKRYQLALNYTAAGTGLIYTACDRSYYSLKTIGAPDAMWCEKCGTKVADSVVDDDLLKQGVPGEGGVQRPVSFVDSAKPVMPDENSDQVSQSTLSYCPTCQDAARPLAPYSPSDEEAETGDDVFGRPLGVQVPKSDLTLEIDMPHEFYPEDGGAKQTPYTMRQFGRRKVRSLEWLEERAPHIVDQIEPDSIADLIYDDPILGDWAILGGWSRRLDMGILDHHFNADEIWALPSFRYPLGRYCLCSQSRVIFDEDLLEMTTIEDLAGVGQDVYVPRVQMAMSRFQIRPGEFWGMTLPDRAISPQNRLNGIDAQMIEQRLRSGPFIMVTPGMWMPEGPAMDSAQGVAKFVVVQPDPENPEAKPEFWGGQLMSDSVHLERQAVQADLRRIVTTQRAGGEAPKGIGTTSGLQLSIDSEEESRTLRKDELIRGAEKSWTHLLNLDWVLTDYEDEYRTMSPDKTWSYQTFRGSALRGQCEVEISTQPSIPGSIMKREAMREAIADDVLTIDSPLAKKAAAEAYGVDPAVNEDTNNQIDAAERAWVDFTQKGIVPVQDTVDNAGLRWQVLGAHLVSEEGEELARKYRWPEILHIIAGWEQDLIYITQMEAQVIAFYGGQRLSGTDAEQAFAMAKVAYQRKMIAYKEQLGIYKQMNAVVIPGAAPIGMAPVPPTPPPPPLQIPVLLQDRINMIFMNKLQKAGWNPRQNDPTAAITFKDPTSYIAFRALCEAYKLTSSGFSTATVPIPTAPAPGSGATMVPADKGSNAMGAAGGAGGADAGNGNVAGTATDSGNPPPPNPVPPTGPLPTGGPH